MTDKAAMKNLDRLLDGITAYCPELSVQSVHQPEHESQNNNVLIINDRFIFRFPKYLHGMESLKQETTLLKHLQGNLTLPIPDPIYHNFEPQEPGSVFCAYQMIPGEPLFRNIFEEMVDPSTKKLLASQLANFLRQMHYLDVTQLPAQFEVQDQVIYWEEMYHQIQQLLFPHMRPDARDWTSCHFSAFLDQSHLHEFSPCLRHGDIGPSNILYDMETHAISGIIDFGSVGLGDPAADLACISCYGEEFFEKFLQEYPADKNTLERVQFYFGTFALQEALSGALDGDPGALERGLATYR